jgi:hypothetical protein
MAMLEASPSFHYAGTLGHAESTSNTGTARALSAPGAAQPAITNVKSKTAEAQIPRSMIPLP